MLQGCVYENIKNVQERTRKSKKIMNMGNKHLSSLILFKQDWYRQRNVKNYRRINSKHNTMGFFQYKNVKFCLLILLQIINDSRSESVLDYVKTLQECDVSVCGKMFVTNEMATDLVVRK